MKKIVLICLLLFAARFAFAEPDAFSVNRDLGRGINLGNMFEAPSETAWGNPHRPEYPAMIAEKGFSHIRLPIRWESAERSLPEAPYTVSADFLKRIQTVVDHALAADLRVIINMHHHHALLENPEEQKERFLAQWTQISEYFAGYSDKLLFEILNEPNGALTPAIWNEYAAEALGVIREMNPTRTVLIGTAEWGGLNALDKLSLPEDDNLILTIHYYLPFLFTHQGAEWTDDPKVAAAVGTKWLGTKAERAAVRADLAKLEAFSKEHEIPVHMGEFGSYSRADLESRVRWTSFVARAFEESGFSWVYWEFSAGFGIYNPSNGEWRQPLVDALLSDSMPAAPVEGVENGG